MENGLTTMDAGASAVHAGPVDVIDAEQALRDLRDWYRHWETATQNERDDAKMARDYYDGDQWTADELKILESRKQPVITVNRIAKKIDYLTGSEIRTRSDPRVLPRTPMHDDAARAMEDAERYVADANDAQVVYSNAFESMIVEGMGAVLVEIESKEVGVPLGASVAASPQGLSVMGAEAVRREYEIKLRHIPWDRLWRDPHSRQPDFSDAKYLGTVAWMDEDDLLATYSKGGEDDERITEMLSWSRGEHDPAGNNTHEDQPEAQSGWYDGSRKRYLVVECYWRVGSRWYCGHAIGSGWVYGPKPSRIKDRDGHPVCPLIVASAKCKRDGTRYGIVRGLTSLQDEVNKRRSKALHAINVDQIVAEDGVVLDKSRLQTERSRPDGYIELARGSLAENRVMFRPGTEIAAGQLQLMQEAKQEIDAVGPDAPVIAGQGGMSGRAILAQQHLGSTELERVFDHFRSLKRRTMRTVFWAICQYWTYEKWLRITDDKSSAGYRFVALNRPMSLAQRTVELMKRGVEPQAALEAAENPYATAAYQTALSTISQSPAAAQIPQEAAQQMAMQQALAAPGMDRVVLDNDISDIDADILLSEAPDTAVVQQEEFQDLAAMAQSGVPIPPEVLIEASQLRNKRKLLEMLKAQQQSASQAQQQAAQQAQQLAIAQAQAGVQKTVAEAHAAHARAGRDEAETRAVMPAAAKDASAAKLHFAQAHKASVEAQATALGMAPEQYRALVEQRRLTMAAGQLGSPSPTQLATLGF